VDGAEFLDAENEFFYDKAADELYLYCPPPAGAFKRPSGVSQKIGFVYSAFYGRAGCLTAKNGGFRPRWAVNGTGTPPTELEVRLSQSEKPH
jgi:hypothetical protein